MKTAIILVTYNGWELTQNCLNDLSAQLNDRENFVVAIADNASTDGTPEKVRTHFPAVHVYESKSNLGFGAANNLAIQGLISDNEDFDAICLINNDTRLSSKAIPQLRDALESAKKVCNGQEAIVVPSVNNKDGSDQPNYFAGLGPEGIGFFKFLRNALKNEEGAAKVLQGTPQPTASNNFSETYWASGVCWMLSRKLYDTILDRDQFFFDPQIFMYYEDADLALRLRSLGARFFICNAIAITHLGGGSAQNNLSRALQHDRSQQYVFKKHFGLQGVVLSKLYRIIRGTVRIAAALPRIGKPEKRSYIKHHLCLLQEVLR